jgi:O6-methylguanine-DNA--protein-cysteine methyltransferase
MALGGMRGCLDYFGDLFPDARLVESEDDNQQLIAGVQAALSKGAEKIALRHDLIRTPFQWSVWKASARIPFGETRTYGEVAAMIGNPHAARAVGQALGANPFPIIFP